ncbi:MAG: Metallo-beta-lactamase superfamily protein [Planctomycetaceae bacterium]|nr:Metallo-beta-lactamase superfamily protein [Planctomycetaceae bacterium]
MDSIRGSFARWCMIICGLGIAWCSSAAADDKNGRLDIYFIDVEGGAATLFVTPSGETMLVDSGYPDNNGRDRDRILKVLKETAGKQQIDHAAVSHWHLDHFGNHAALAASVPVKTFWDRGIPEKLSEDGMFESRIAPYRAASQNQSKKLVPGDFLTLKSGETPLKVKVVTASGEVIPNSGEPNPYASKNVPQADDPSDNAKSLSFLLSFGKFSFLCCGDLTWNVEAKLVTPNNPLGHVEMFMVTHHGLNVSNNPVLVQAIQPHVTVMCNGPKKGGNPETIKTLRELKSLEAAFQLHRNVDLSPADQTPAEYIANTEPSSECKGRSIKASIAPGGGSYTVQILPDGKVWTFQTR